MTDSNLIELIILSVSILAAFLLVGRSNQKVSDLDGLGEVTKVDHRKGTIVAQL